MVCESTNQPRPPSIERPPTMTTESKYQAGPEQPSAHSGAGVLFGAALWGLGAAVLTTVVALAVKGGQAGVGALVGAVSSLAVLAIGTWVVLRVSRVSPMASLIAALAVFTGQGGLLLITLAVLSQVTSGPQVRWAAIAVIVVTVVWTTLFAIYARKERIPLFDLGAATSADAHGADAR